VARDDRRGYLDKAVEALRGQTGVTVRLVSPIYETVPVGGPRGLYEGHHYIMPRVGFAYSPFDDNKTSIRGGFGMYYDRIEGNLIFPSLSNPPYATSAQFQNANLNNITGGSPTLAPFAQINAINPELDTPYTMSYSLSLQRELPYGIFAEAAYVANLGRHLIRQPDVNQPTFEQLILYQADRLGGADHKGLVRTVVHGQVHGRVAQPDQVVAHAGGRAQPRGPGGHQSGGAGRSASIPAWMREASSASRNAVTSASLYNSANQSMSAGVKRRSARRSVVSQ